MYRILCPLALPFTEVQRSWACLVSMIKMGCIILMTSLHSEASACGLSPRRMKSCSAVAWNPLKAMQLVGACDHHLSPTMLRWELQQPRSPFELLGHEQV